MAITKNVPEIPTPNINLYVTKFEGKKYELKYVI